MKPHYDANAPAKVREAVESAAIHGQGEAMAACYRAGYNWLPADVKTPLLNREVELLAAGNRVRLAEFRAVSSVGLADERKCLARAAGMQVRWASEPTASEAAATAAAARAQATKEQAITERTNAILAGENFKREIAARARATKEIES